MHVHKQKRGGCGTILVVIRTDNRETDRQTHTQTHRHTDTHTQTQTHTHTHKHTNTDTHAQIQTREVPCSGMRGKRAVMMGPVALFGSPSISSTTARCCQQKKHASTSTPQRQCEQSKATDILMPTSPSPTARCRSQQQQQQVRTRATGSGYRSRLARLRPASRFSVCWIACAQYATLSALEDASSAALHASCTASSKCSSCSSTWERRPSTSRPLMVAVFPCFCSSVSYVSFSSRSISSSLSGCSLMRVSYSSAKPCTAHTHAHVHRLVRVASLFRWSAGCLLWFLSLLHIQTANTETNETRMLLYQPGAQQLGCCRLQVHPCIAFVRCQSRQALRVQQQQRSARESGCHRPRAAPGTCNQTQ